MIDIVEYLRNSAKRFDEAADEIERLRVAVGFYARDYDHEAGCSVWDGGEIARAALRGHMASKPDR